MASPKLISLLLLFTIDGLILSGVGHYYSNLGGKQSLMLTPNKWNYNIYSKLPITFSEMRLSGQYFTTFVTTIILIITIISHIMQLYWCKYSRLLFLNFSVIKLKFWVKRLHDHFLDDLDDQEWKRYTFAKHSLTFKEYNNETCF
ncbi:unnamed protein product [Onchocerca flexuosa]|uniref:Uncharacterized protein n=1 Tax=Onchocerca flexuosa TaxID=387005 RepID=A0A183HIX6_9BILA|nr:unnamed protein product [Onchocerca flexuosa]